MEVGKVYRVREEALKKGTTKLFNVALVRDHGYIWVGPIIIVGDNLYYKSLATGEHALWYRDELDLLEE